MYCLPRGIELYYCIIGTMRAGAAFVLSETEGDPKRTEYIRKDCACRVFVSENELEEIKKTAPLEGFEPVQLHSLCYIAYTSGTTGHPKGVLHEYGSLENAWKSLRMNGNPLLLEEDVFLAMSPMNFVSLPIIFSFSCVFGNTAALMPYSCKDSSEAFQSYLEAAGVNCGYLTPSFLRSHLPFCVPWRMCILSSEPADGLFLEHTECYNCYASTESGCLLTVYELKEAMTPAPVGKPQSGIDVYVLNEDGMEVPAGTIGEVCYRNPYVRGYLHLPEKTQNLMRGRLFHTGDAGEIDPDGNLILHGRLDEMFKIGGNRIEPEEIAAAVREVSGLKHFTVRGFVYQDISSIVVFYTDEIDLDEEALRTKLLERLPEYMIPTGYIHLREFPLLVSGKLDKLRLLPPEGSWDAFRKLSASNLPVIGKGRTASVYDMGDHKVLKLFKPSIPFTVVRQELVLTQAAFSAGLPVPDAYEIVRSGPHYGILLDQVEGEELEHVLKENPDQRRQLIRSFAETVRALHAVKVSDERLPDLKAVSVSLTEQLDASFCSREEAARIRSVFEHLPDADTFVHGDCHAGNVMMKDSRMRFIDLTLSGKGDPVFDLLCMYSHYVFLPSFGTDESCIARLGMDRREAEALYEEFLRAYYALPEEADISERSEAIKGVHSARICLASAVMPGVFPDEVLRAAKERAIRYAANLEAKASVQGRNGKG